MNFNHILVHLRPRSKLSIGYVCYFVLKGEAIQVQPGDDPKYLLHRHNHCLIIIEPHANLT